MRNLTATLCLTLAVVRARRLRKRRSRGVAMVAPVEVGAGGVELLVSNGLLEQHQDQQLDRPIAEVMTVDPLRVGQDELLERAVELLTRHKISELPVVDSRDEPVGLIDITDVIGLTPTEIAAG